MKIVLTDKPMSQMTLAEQEEVWKLSRENEVYEQDINGELWRVLDLSGPSSQSVKMLVKEDKHNDADNPPSA